MLSIFLLFSLSVEPDLVALAAASALSAARVLSAATALLVSLAWARAVSVAVMAALLEAGVTALPEGVIVPVVAVLTFLA